MAGLFTFNECTVAAVAVTAWLLKQFTRLPTLRLGQACAVAIVLALPALYGLATSHAYVVKDYVPPDGRAPAAFVVAFLWLLGVASAAATMAVLLPSRRRAPLPPGRRQARARALSHRLTLRGHLRLRVGIALALIGASVAGLVMMAAQGARWPGAMLAVALAGIAAEGWGLRFARCPACHAVLSRHFAVAIALGLDRHGQHACPDCGADVDSTTP